MLTALTQTTELSERLQDASAKLQARDLAAGFMHGEMSKEDRTNVLRQFRLGQLRVLVVSGALPCQADAVFGTAASQPQSLACARSQQQQRHACSGRAGDLTVCRCWAAWVLSCWGCCAAFCIQLANIQLYILC